MKEQLRYVAMGLAIMMMIVGGFGAFFWLLDQFPEVLIGAFVLLVAYMIGWSHYNAPRSRCE